MAPVIRDIGDSVLRWCCRPKMKLTSGFEIQLSPENPYLSYHDVRLTKDDVDTLKDDWLTDNIIAFWEEYGSPLEQNCFWFLASPATSGQRAPKEVPKLNYTSRYLEREQLDQFPNSHIVLLRPSMSFMLMQTKDPMTIKDVLPDFSRTTHIFLPINDCRNVEQAEGGSHWTLLLVSVVDGVAFHYDSLSVSNLEEAVVVTKQLGILLGKRIKLVNQDDCPQQENSTDCGVFVCIQMRHLLLKRLLQATAKDKVSMSMAGKNVDAIGGRKEILRLIEERRKQGEKRRS
ncbi:MAG: hypothetical protein M1836_004632 [Candelina mexicana]|nr:MAG: hypothetical protein M1836_004632 [Candelina mexicana]